MLTVHHLENSRSQRVLWLLEELGVEYEIKVYRRRRSGLAPKELQDVHPMGKSPVVTHDGLTLAESAVILEYLLDEFGEGRLRPAPGTPEFLQYRYWMHFAEGTGMPPLILKLVFRRLENVGPPVVKQIVRGVSKKVQTDFVDKELALRANFIEDHLGKNEWFTGDQMTAADIQMSYVVKAYLIRGPEGAEYPNMRRFVDRVEALPAYQRGIERGGPLSVVPR